eukprot:scaffold8161_cov111-Cylindrotheca_fusiformis.AAC.6
MASSRVEANEARCRQIIECKEQIEYWKAKLEVLEEEQELNITLARLRLDAPATWRLLSRQQRIEKRFILAAFESDELPSALEDFSNMYFPPQIRMDRDILMARVARKNFAEKYKNERLFVPPKLRGDKELIMAIAIHHPQVIECMANELRDDTDILQAVLAREKLPALFLQHFSARLRSNQEIMINILKHPDGLPSMAFCDASLRNDKDFFLRAVNCGHHSSDNQLLRYASQRLQGDFDVVFSCVRKSGMNLKHASYELRRDKSVVVAATRQNPAAFRYCLPGTAKQELLQDRAFVAAVVDSAPISIVKSCVELFQQDREVVLLALSNGLEWSSVPEHFQKQPDFVLEAVDRSNGRVYTELPPEVQNDFEVALQVLKCEHSTGDAIVQATERCPELQSNREAMMFVARNWKIKETLQFAPTHIRNDKSIMLEAIKKNSIAFEFCSNQLRHDRDVVLAAVNSSSAALYYTDSAFQMQNPDIVIRALQNARKEDLWLTFDDIYVELWSNRDVAKAWLSSGGGWLGDAFPEEFCEDEEIVLALIEQNWSEFNWVSESLKRDKEFLLKALAVDGRIIRDVDEELRYDEDLVLAAISNDPRSIQFYSGGKDFVFMVSFAQKIRDHLREHDLFQDEIMGAMSSPFDTDDSLLPMLNQGPATLAMYSKKLSSYLGILTDSNKIAQFRAVSLSLLPWGL